MKILVTGAAGLIGSHLCDILLAEGHHVTGIDDFSHGNRSNLMAAAKNINFNFKVTKVQFVSLWKEKYDVIFHLASLKKPVNQSINSSVVLDDNYEMIKSVVKEAKKCGSKLIFTSTSDVYGNSENFDEKEPITIGPPTNERYSYALSKLYGEQHIFNELQQSTLKAVVVRIFGCSSYRASKTWSGGHVPLFINNALLNKDIIIHGDGLQTRAISHAIDIATGLKQVMDNFDKCNNEIINLGTDQQTTVKEVAEYIVTKTKSKSKIIFKPRTEIFGDYKEILVRFANTKKAEQLFNFKITYSTYDVIDEIIDKF